MSGVHPVHVRAVDGGGCATPCPGVEGLRVVAASVLPKQITGNPNGPIIMIAEKAADLILNRPPLPPAEFSTSN